MLMILNVCENDTIGKGSLKMQEQIHEKKRELVTQHTHVERLTTLY